MWFKRSHKIVVVAEIASFFVMALLFSFAPPNTQYSLLNTVYTSLSKIPFEGGSFTTDNLQNVYVFRGSSLKKYNSQGQLLYSYSDKSYGRITEVDANDPMKVLVFYKDFPEVVLLDNTLSVNGSPFSPSDVGYPLSTLACTSHDDGVWLYDAQNFQLIRVDVNLNVTVKTGNFAQTLGINLNPDYMIEYDNYLYLNDSAQGILVFDSYGTYYKTIPLTGLRTFQVRGNDLFYIAQNRIHTFHLKALLEDVTMAPDTLASEVRVEKNILFEKYRDSVRVYDVKEAKN
jgi:hypothetical protein